MPDGEPASDDSAEMSSVAAVDPPAGPVLSGPGMATVALGVLAVAAAVLIGLIWTRHSGEEAERARQTDAMRAAADWTAVLINMNKDNVDTSLQKLRAGTVGQLSADFEAAVKPYRELVQTLQSRTSGGIDSVAIEAIHHDLDLKPGAQPPVDDSSAERAAVRTDTVMVVATSVSENVGGQPKTVRWNLLLDVSDVDGRLLISRLVSMR